MIWQAEHLVKDRLLQNFILNGWFQSGRDKSQTLDWWVCSHMYIIAVHPHTQAVVQVCDEITGKCK